MTLRRSIVGALLAAALVVVASPAVAMTPKTVTPKTVTPKTVIPGWSPSDPPADRAVLAARLADVTYSVSCGDVRATGWSADVYDDPAADAWKAILVTTSAMSAACTSRPEALVVRQGALTVEARPFVASTAHPVGTIEVKPDLPYLDWDFVPTPRIGQWVGIAARGIYGEVLPMLERRVTAVGTGSFTLNSPVDATHVGAPVVDNTGRALGTVTAADSVVMGSPVYCGELFECTDSARVWWDITAPSEVTDVKKVSGKRSVTVTWKAAANNGGDEVAYWYRVGIGPWKKADTFKVTVKARKGQRVVVSIVTVNQAGPGPTVVVSARAK